MKIGLFWIYDKQIFPVFQNLSDIKEIDGFKDSDLSHYQTWDFIKMQHEKFYLYEYEDITRGRVVYDVKNDTFIIYCNKLLLQDDDAKKLIINAFTLVSKQYFFREDEHYQIN